MNQIPVTVENIDRQIARIDNLIEINVQNGQNLLVLKAMLLEERAAQECLCKLDRMST